MMVFDTFWHFLLAAFLITSPVTLIVWVLGVRRGARNLAEDPRFILIPALPINPKDEALVAALSARKAIWNTRPLTRRAKVDFTGCSEFPTTDELKQRHPGLPWDGSKPEA